MCGLLDIDEDLHWIDDTNKRVPEWYGCFYVSNALGLYNLMM